MIRLGTMSEPMGYCGTVKDLKDKLANLPDNAKLYISGDDYGNGASLMLEDYTTLIER